MSDSVIFWLFVAGLAWLPWPEGSNGLQAWGVNAMLFPSLAIAYELSLLVARKPHPVAAANVGVAAVLFLAVVVWIVLQSATFLPRMVHAPLWALANEALGIAPAGSISINRDLTLQALVRLLTAASVFWLAMQLGRDAVRADRLMAAIAIIGTGYAIFGLLQFALTSGHFLPGEPGRPASFVSSTFFNRNNFATYAGCGVIVLTGLLMRLYRHSVVQGVPARQRLAAFLDITGKGGAVLICGLFIVVVALLLSGSRGGIISALFAGFVLLVLTFAQQRKSASGQRGIVVAAGLVILVIFIAFGDGILGKIGQQGFGDDARLAIYRLTADSIAGAPLFGHGYGTFADAFPIYRDHSLDTGGVWLMAHNTYLEVLQGLGLPSAIMLIGAVGWLSWRCIAGAQLRKLNATLPLIAGSAACLIAVNALVDFSLQIQAVTLTFMALLGVGVAQSESSQLALHD